MITCLFTIKVFEQQNAILQAHIQYIAILPSLPHFTINTVCNVTDKGFRCDEAAAKFGQTMVRAPLKQVKKTQLSPLDALRTAFIAAGRGDNERMVGRPFFFALLYNGFRNVARMDLINYHWLTLNAKTNFMFRPLTLSKQTHIIVE